jgi:hypothetical protein
MDFKRISLVVKSKPGSLPEVETGDIGGAGAEIRCPLCGWTPNRGDVWACTCRYLWNTFDTGGVCPGCLRRWTMTACLSCHQWSPHSDWYPKN